MSALKLLSHIFILLNLSHSIRAQETNVTVAFWAGDALPLAIVTDQNQSNWRGIEVGLMNTICPMLGGCTFITLETLDDRFKVVQPGGPANMSIGIISVTPERQKIVDFVKPYYYSAGATLYSTPTAAEEIMANGGWDRLAGKPICVLSNFYFNIQAEHSAVPVTVETSNEGVSKVESGDCVALLYDTGYSDTDIGLNSIPGLVPQAGSPLGIAVSKTSSPELLESLSAAMIRVMQNGPESTMIQLEKEYASNLPPNINLIETVGCISTFHNEVGIVKPLNATPTALLPIKVKATPAIYVPSVLPLGLVPTNAKEVVSSPDFTWPLDWEGFEIAIINKLCTTTLDCAPPILLEDLEDYDTRFDVLDKQGEQENVFVAAAVSASKKRSQLASFIRPYYYSVGPVIYTTEANAQEFVNGGNLPWECISGRPVCVEELYYAAEEIQGAASPKLVYVKSLSEAREKVESGECIGLIYDSSSIIDGLIPIPGMESQFVSPLGIIMSKDGDPNLYAAISAGLVDMMDDGDDSEMLKHEAKWFGDLPGADNDLERVVCALSDFGIVKTSFDGDGGREGEGGGDLNLATTSSNGAAMGKMTTGLLVIIIITIITFF
jgi:ABC-type amino acid transport substrate-binding protein